MARFGQRIEGFGRNGGQKLRGYVTVSALIALLAGASLVQAQPKHQHPKHKEDSKHQVEKLEETWRTAQLNGDIDTMDKLLSEDYVGITMNGQVVTKMQQLDRMRTRTLSVTKIELDDVKVKLIAADKDGEAVLGAVVTSRAVVEGTNDGEPMHGTYRYTRVYSRTPGGVWKITNFEATRVGAPGARRVRGPEVPAGSEGAASPVPQKLVAGNNGR